MSGVPFRVSLGAALFTIQAATFRTTWRGVPMVKNPFDLALYPMLLWHLKPRTVVELGSASGGSAIWFADQLLALGIRAHVYSIDIKPPAIEDPCVTFLRGDARQVPELLIEQIERPLLVIDDASHDYGQCLETLEAWAPQLRAGEYMVVEDGIVTALGQAARFDGGPLRAIEEFLSRHRGEFEVDRGLCDFYGRNVTWNPNGYLRCTRA